MARSEAPEVEIEISVPVPDSLQEIAYLHLFRTIRITDGGADCEDAVVRPGREFQQVHGSCFFEESPPFSVFYARFTSLCTLIFNHIFTAQRIRMASSP